MAKTRKTGKRGGCGTRRVTKTRYGTMGVTNRPPRKPRKKRKK